MRSTLTTSTLESKFPVMAVEHDDIQAGSFTKRSVIIEDVDARQEIGRASCRERV